MLLDHDLVLGRLGGEARVAEDAVAVPVALAQAGETLVFNCGVLAARLEPRALERDVGPQLVRLARSVEAELQRPS